MSTDIFESDFNGSSRPNPYARLGPIQIYLVLSLPLTLVTLLFWAASHWWYTRKENWNRNMHQEKLQEA